MRMSFGRSTRIAGARSDCGITAATTGPTHAHRRSVRREIAARSSSAMSLDGFCDRRLRRLVQNAAHVLGGEAGVDIGEVEANRHAIDIGNRMTELVPGV